MSNFIMSLQTIDILNFFTSCNPLWVRVLLVMLHFNCEMEPSPTLPRDLEIEIDLDIEK